MSRVGQYETYSGELDPVMPDGDYMQVRTLGADLTSNEFLWLVWDRIGTEAQLISTSPAAQQPLMTEDLVRKVLQAIDRCFVAVQDRTMSRTAGLFVDTFGGPSQYNYEPYPLRWPAESRWALRVMLKFVSALFQIPQVKCNRLDRGILEVHAAIIMKPLWHLKADIMRELFGKEVQGDVSPHELEAIFADSNVKPPLNWPADLSRQSDAQATERREAALQDESAETPPQEKVDQAMRGVEVWTWIPDQADMTVFAEMVKRMETDGPGMQPVEPVDFDVNVLRTGPSGTAAVAARPKRTRPSSRASRA